MGLKKNQILMSQKADFERRLQDRLAFLAGRGIKSPQADKDALVKKMKADVKAVNYRLRQLADNEKKMEGIAKAKAEKAAAPPQEHEGAKPAKPKKAPEEGKEKKPKAEKRPAPPKPQGEAKGQE